MFKSKNLLILTSEYPDCENKIIGDPFVKSQVDLLAKYFKNVYVISVRPYFPQFLSRLLKFNLSNLKNYSYNNIKVYYPKILDFPVDYFRKRRGDRYFKVVDKLIKKEKIKFDLIHAHFTYPPGYVGIKLKEKYGKPLVVTAHGGDIYKLPFISNYWRNKVSRVLKKADKVITVSKRNANCIRTLGFKSIIIPNGFDQNLFFPQDKIKCRKKLNLPLDKKIILTIGSLVEIKGQKYLVSAMKTIVQYNKHIVCYIVGDGELKNDLNKQIEELSLKDYIKLVGARPHSEIPIWMNACDLFVLPSLSESFGIVQVEAIACGIPIIATKNGGSEEIIISKEYGLLCEPGNPKDLSKKILIALNKKWDKNKILKYSKKFMWNKIVKDIIRCYISVLYSNLF